MVTKTTTLKALLRQRHLQGHQSFCKEYDKVASKTEPELRGSGPSKAQFYRWLSGDLSGMPHSHHCRILERMFPEWTAEQLFQQHDSAIGFVPEPPTKPEKTEERSAPPPAGKPEPAQDMAGIVAAFSSRSDFSESMPPNRLFDGAHHVQLAGLSLNNLCQHYSDKSLIKMLESGSVFKCLFLNRWPMHQGP